ncbi:hypothetical protein EXIGLDRAFT_473366 [Exidia glandulosa HHB12029]|uniref:Uncharacterized protein n=1 Tax=Exidia glandulosa HHB12029 TaxID=1314781 RepID=A0A165JY99_EXIGL|nr:hypothetical protein EXIGLDRAFT_473366 [Exidia glandulosa HHB12029]
MVDACSQLGTVEGARCIIRCCIRRAVVRLALQPQPGPLNARHRPQLEPVRNSFALAVSRVHGVNLHACHDIKYPKPSPVSITSPVPVTFGTPTRPCCSLAPPTRCTTVSRRRLLSPPRAVAVPDVIDVHTKSEAPSYRPRRFTQPTLARPTRAFHLVQLQLTIGYSISNVYTKLGRLIQRIRRAQEPISQTSELVSRMREISKLNIVYDLDRTNLRPQSRT